MREKPPRIAVFISTFDKTNDARIQMEIIREVWQQDPFFQNISIFHLYNGKKEWYREKYKENSLLTFKNKGHYEGAVHLINQIPKILKKENSFDLVIHASSDVWIFHVDHLKKLLSHMLKEEYHLASTVWGHPLAFSTEFFIATPTMCSLVLPLDLETFVQQSKYEMPARVVIPQYPFVERCFADSFFHKTGANPLTLIQDKYFLPITGREYVIPISPLKGRFESDWLGYCSNHNEDEKRVYARKFLPNEKNLRSCPYLSAFLHPYSKYERIA